MQVKQLIYTSWKNGSSTKKGFMIYSQSVGILEEDADFITNYLRYVTLPSLPYSPTWEEIETLFPRNAVYFRLPSGKYCLAQSSYLGKDYSGRLGNYIIHAYVLDQQPNFNTLDLIGSDVYRRAMTEEELNAECNPPALPEIELPMPPVNADLNRFKEFFVGDNLVKLKKLVAGVMHAVENGKQVFVYDDNNKLDLWYKALYFCLPKSVTH